MWSVKLTVVGSARGSNSCFTTLRHPSARMASTAAKSHPKIVLLADVGTRRRNRALSGFLAGYTRSQTSKFFKRCRRVPVSATLLRPRESVVKRPRTCLNRRCGCRAVSLLVRRAIALSRYAQAEEPWLPARAARAARPNPSTTTARATTVASSRRSRRALAASRRVEESSPGVMEVSAQVRVRGGGGGGGTHRRRRGGAAEEA